MDEKQGGFFMSKMELGASDILLLVFFSIIMHLC